MDLFWGVAFSFISVSLEELVKLLFMLGVREAKWEVRYDFSVRINKEILEVEF